MSEINRQLEEIMPKVADKYRDDLARWVSILQSGGYPPDFQRADAAARIVNRPLIMKGGEKAPLFEDAAHIICACGKKKSVLEMKARRSSAQALYVDDVCEGCEKVYKDTCKLVCPACKRVRARMTPRTDKLGFAFERGKTYHLDGCAACSGGDKSDIIEKLLHDRKIGKSLIR